MDEANEHVRKLDGSGAKLPGSRQNRIRQVKNLIVFQVIKDWHELQETLEIWKMCRFKWIHLFQLNKEEGTKCLFRCIIDWGFCLIYSNSWVKNWCLCIWGLRIFCSLLGARIRGSEWSVFRCCGVVLRHFNVNPTSGPFLAGVKCSFAVAFGSARMRFGEETRVPSTHEGVPVSQGRSMKFCLVFKPKFELQVLSG